MLQRRRRTILVLLVVAGLGLLALPGHTFGATNEAGLATDVAGSAVLAPGMVYVVQPGDTMSSIAAKVNPVDPALARMALVRELGSSYVVDGEHVLIP
jgi:predicted Zn-dependent protease